MLFINCINKRHPKEIAALTRTIVGYPVGRSLLSSLSVDVVLKFVSLGNGSSMSTELSSSLLDRLLLDIGQSCSEHFEHLLLEWRESGDLSDDGSHQLNSLGGFSLLGNWSSFPSLLGWSVDDVTGVESDVKSASVVSFSHVFT